MLQGSEEHRDAYFKEFTRHLGWTRHTPCTNSPVIFSSVCGSVRHFSTSKWIPWAELKIKDGHIVTDVTDAQWHARLCRAFICLACVLHVIHNTPPTPTPVPSSFTFAWMVIVVLSLLIISAEEHSVLPSYQTRPQHYVINNLKKEPQQSKQSKQNFTFYNYFLTK